MRNYRKRKVVGMMVRGMNITAKSFCWPPEAHPADWAEPFQKGVIYYLREGRVRGVLLWNVWDKVPNARELIAQPGPFRAEDLNATKATGLKIAY